MRSSGTALVVSHDALCARGKDKGQRSRRKETPKEAATKKGKKAKERQAGEGAARGAFVSRLTGARDGAAGGGPSQVATQRARVCSASVTATTQSPLTAVCPSLPLLTGGIVLQSR